MEDIVIRAIKKLQDDKRKANIVPNHASEVDLYKLISKAVRITINKLVEEKKIKRNQTVGADHFEVI